MIVMVIVIVIREIHDSWHVMIVIIPKEVRLRASGRPRRARNRTTHSHRFSHHAITIAVSEHRCETCKARSR